MDAQRFEKVYGKAKTQRILGNRTEAIRICTSWLQAHAARQPGTILTLRQYVLLLELRGFSYMQDDDLHRAETDIQRALAELQNNFSPELELEYIHVLTTQVRLQIRQGRRSNCEKTLVELGDRLGGRHDEEALRLQGTVWSLTGVLRHLQKRDQGARLCFAKAEEIFCDYGDIVRRLRNFRRLVFSAAYFGHRWYALGQLEFLRKLSDALMPGGHTDTTRLISLIRLACWLPIPTKWVLGRYQKEAGF